MNKPNDHCVCYIPLVASLSEGMRAGYNAAYAAARERNQREYEERCKNNLDTPKT